MGKCAKNSITVAKCPDRGAGNDPEPLWLSFDHEQKILCRPVTGRGGGGASGGSSAPPLPKMAKSNALTRLSSKVSKFDQFDPPPPNTHTHIKKSGYEPVMRL